MYLYLPSSYTGKIVLSSDHVGNTSLSALTCSLVIPYNNLNASVATTGIAV